MRRKKDLTFFIFILAVNALFYYIVTSGDAPENGPLILEDFQIENAIVRKFNDDGNKQKMIDTDVAYSIVDFINELDIEKINSISNVDSTYSVSFSNDNYDIITLTFLEDDTLWYRFTGRKKKLFSNEYKYKRVSGEYQIISQDFDTSIFEELF